tara:strand:- start:307 stop:783 length:477 start_codon:yes stop_codon:yes gene_type:complete
MNNELRKNIMQEIDNMITRESVINLTYWQEYQDPEDHDFFKIHHTIFRNVPLSQLKRLNSESFKNKIKKYCDKHYIENASNATGHSGVDMIHGSEYYNTYYDVFGAETSTGLDNALFNDYGQLWNGRQFFKYDFKPELTERYSYKNLNKQIGGYTNDN